MKQLARETGRTVTFNLQQVDEAPELYQEALRLLDEARAEGVPQLRGQFSGRPVGVLMGVLLPSGLFYFLEPGVHASPGFHLFGGSAILCAFFVATDPVTAATSDRGRLVYGFGIGILIYVIRRWGSYADGVAFAVLLMNMAVPAIDYVTRPHIVGHSKASRGADQ